MPRIKSITGRYMEKHPYMKEAQEEANLLSSSINPITLQWESAQIVRIPKTGKIARRVMIVRDDVIVWDSNEKPI